MVAAAFYFSTMVDGGHFLGPIFLNWALSTLIDHDHDWPFVQKCKEETFQDSGQIQIKEEMSGGGKPGGIDQIW